MPRKRKWQPTLNAQTTKHEVVRRAAKGHMKLTESENDFTVCWTDGVVSLAKLLSLKPWQRINHFPGMHNICHKDYLAKNLEKMRKLFPTDYKFWPRTWCVTTESADLMLRIKTKKKRQRWFIAKPDAKSKGIGIYLFSRWEDLRNEPNMIAQEYIDRPFVIDGYKFDMRIYVVITNCDPLRLYVYKDGLARFATEKYCSPTAANREQVCMHLTNYSINRKSKNFVDGGMDEGSKRTLQWLWGYLDKQGISSQEVWGNIKHILVKTMITVQPELAKVFRSSFASAEDQFAMNGSPCFELLGFDVMLDHKLRPFVLEVNHSPSLSCETQVDYVIKDALLNDIYYLLNLSSLNPTKWKRQAREEAKQRLYASVPVTTTTTAISKDKISSARAPSADTVKISLDDVQVSSSKPAIQEIISIVKHEATHMGAFECLFPPTDFLLLAKYQTYLDAATSNLFINGETNALRARRSHLEKQTSNKQQRDKGPRKINSNSVLPIVPRLARTLSASAVNQRTSINVDADIANHLNKRAVNTRSTLKLNTGTLGSISISLGSSNDSSYGSMTDQLVLPKLASRSIDRVLTPTVRSSPKNLNHNRLWHSDADVQRY